MSIPSKWAWLFIFAKNHESKMLLSFNCKKTSTRLLAETEKGNKIWRKMTKSIVAFETLLKRHVLTQHSYLYPKSLYLKPKEPAVEVQLYSISRLVSINSNAVFSTEAVRFWLASVLYQSQGRILIECPMPLS